VLRQDGFEQLEGEFVNNRLAQAGHTDRLVVIGDIHAAKGAIIPHHKQTDTVVRRDIGQRP
jgi:hypothetical protein